MTSLSESHTFCHYGDDNNDGRYQTISRQDEEDLDILTRKVNIDYSRLTECKDGHRPGLMCTAGDCLKNYKWCRTDLVSITCGETDAQFSQNHPGLCRNTTFWSDKTCDVFYSDGDKAALGHRCSGGMQHCSYPWYLSSNYLHEVS